MSREQEFLRLIEGLAREKNIDKETLLQKIEAGLAAALRKEYAGKVKPERPVGAGEVASPAAAPAADPSKVQDKRGAPLPDITVTVNRQLGSISATVNGRVVGDMETLGRIAAQTAKQVIIQQIREAERGSLYEQYSVMIGKIVTGRVGRWEGGSLIVDLGRVEAILPKSEQIPGDSHEVDERVRAMILDVREQPSALKIVLSRTHPNFIKALFDLEVPEVAEKIIEIKAMAREAGYRTKVAVNSLDSKVDAVGACVGIRGSRIKNIVDELGGEKIDIVRWNDSSKILIANSLKPAEVAEIALCFELGRATVVVTDDQLSLAIGKRGQNVRLGARLTGWDIDILTPTEFNAGLDILEKALREVPGVDSTIVDQIVAMGMVNVLDVEEVGPEPLINEFKMQRELAQKIVIRCAEEAKRVAEQQAADKDRARSAQAAEAAAAAAAEKDRVQAAQAAEAAEKDQAQTAQAVEAAEPGKDQAQAAQAASAAAPEQDQAQVAQPVEAAEPEQDQAQAAQPAEEAAAGHEPSASPATPPAEGPVQA
jgi:N utilization substance protein A